MCDEKKGNEISLSVDLPWLNFFLSVRLNISKRKLAFFVMPGVYIPFSLSLSLSLPLSHTFSRLISLFCFNLKASLKIYQ